MREKRWLLLALYGILLANAISAERKATRPKFKIATTSTTTTTTTTEESQRSENEDVEATTTATVAAGGEANATSGHVLTGIPQIDYIWDPNLPRELNGYNLSDYPFYNSIPEDIDFKCDGLHDGFYASVPHKCQVYHHCLFGTRYDFLCANFTAFDQKTFICHFVSEVDCANSRKYWHRNDALYKATTTSTTSTTSTTTTTTTSTTTALPPVTAAAGSRQSPRDLPRRRRPFRRRPPVYDYYDEEYYDDDYTRPRGGYGRDEYDYDDRKYRNRDREFVREREFRDRDSPRSREGGAPRDERDRYPARNNRREPARGRDPPFQEEDSRVRSRDPEQGSRSSVSREVEDPELDERRIESRLRDADDRRYPVDKRYRDDYEDKDPVSAGGGSSDGLLVKPAAPATSLYARPRTPPKIRRPVPLSEQDKYAYKTTAVQSTEEPRRRPVDIAEDDYYEDELEDVRPIRRPLRRRPSSYRDRDRDRDFYDERDRGRPFRSRYRDDEDELRPRKHPDRSRDRYYDRDRDRGVVERGRDRSLLDRGKDRGRGQEGEKQERVGHRPPIDKEDRSRSKESRSKDTQEGIGESSPSRVRDRNYDRTTASSTAPSTTSTTTTTTSSTTTTTTCSPEQPPPRRTESVSSAIVEKSAQGETLRGSVDPRAGQQSDYLDAKRGDRYQVSMEEYSQEEYYDEAEDPPSPPPRATIRVVKRPFLPSRGGNPNPRGLSPVGAKAAAPKRLMEEEEEEEEEKSSERAAQERGRNYHVHHQTAEESSRELESRGGEKENVGYKKVETEIRDEHGSQYDLVARGGQMRRPGTQEKTHRGEDGLRSADDGLARGSKGQQEGGVGAFEEGLGGGWAAEEFSSPAQSSVQSYRGKGGRVASPGSENPVYGFKNQEEIQENPTGPQSFSKVKQRLNEVTHRLQDIPESEYDVTLNDALTPTLNQETSLPSGFVLPLHRQLGRDAILQSSESNYKVSRPVISDHQHQKSFVPNPQYLSAVDAGGNDRLRAVYYRTPETIQIGGTQYRPQRGGLSWQDYTGY